MNLDINIIIKLVCCMARDFKARGDVSMVMLLKESGYKDSAESITEKLIEEYLKENQYLIESWLLNSMDNRSSPSWYISESQPSNNFWLVGFYPNGKIYKFQDRTKACAFYLKQYLEALKVL